MATTTAQNLDNSINTLAQPSDPNPTAEIESPPASAPSKEEIKAEAPVVDGGAGEVTDTQKKMKRADRFGMPVKLSENEKRSSRAERFGTATSVQGSDALKKAEEEKRKARAERFGLVQSDTTNQEAKKKARLDRFTPPTKIDPVEEDKKKARAIRLYQLSNFTIMFSKSESGSQPQANGKGKIEEETVVVNKAAEAT